MPESALSQKPNTTHPISRDVAAMLLRADASALIQKAKDKKPLNRQERAYLLSLASGSEASNATGARNYEELAAMLGVSTRALRDWRKMVGAPRAGTDGKGHDVGAWRAFIKAHGLKDTSESNDTGESDEDLPGMDELKQRKLFADVQAREFELAIKRREYVSMALVREQWTGYAARAIAILRKKLEDELPPLLAGMDAQPLRVEMSRVVDEFVAEVRDVGGVQDD